eukprot:1229810-Prymnesium_polylepis.2
MKRIRAVVHAHGTARPASTSVRRQTSRARRPPSACRRRVRLTSGVKRAPSSSRAPSVMASCVRLIGFTFNQPSSHGSSCMYAQSARCRSLIVWYGSAPARSSNSTASRCPPSHAASSGEYASAPLSTPRYESSCGLARAVSSHRTYRFAMAASNTLQAAPSGRMIHRPYLRAPETRRRTSRRPHGISRRPNSRRYEQRAR